MSQNDDARFAPSVRYTPNAIRAAVALHPWHIKHNIPFPASIYSRSGLPVMGDIWAVNDLAMMSREERVGQACEPHQAFEHLQLTNRLLDQIETNAALSGRFSRLFEREFEVQKTVKQLLVAILAYEALRP